MEAMIVNIEISLTATIINFKTIIINSNYFNFINL